MSKNVSTTTKYLTKENESTRNTDKNKINSRNYLSSLPKEEMGKEVFLRKYCIIGAPNVGKTSIIQRFAYKKAPDFHNSSIEEVHFKSFIYDNQIYDCKFADTRGYIPNAVFSYNYPYLCDGFFLIYSIDDRESFELIPQLYEKILIKFADKKVPVIVVGNKSDLSSTSRVVSRKEGAIIAEKFNNAPFLECNAFDEFSVNTVFEVMIYHDNTTRNFYQIKNKKSDTCKIF